MSYLGDIFHFGQHVKAGSFRQSQCAQTRARTPDAHFREGKEFSLHVVVEFDDFEKGKEMMKSEKFKTIQEFRRANTDEENSSFMLLEGGDTIS